MKKTKQEQLTRVRDKAEVLTPSWICNKQNNLVDSAWFGRENVFNVEQEKTWVATQEKISFPDGKTWQDYVNAKRLEITGGEAPYIASRYDTERQKHIVLSLFKTLLISRISIGQSPLPKSTSNSMQNRTSTKPKSPSSNYD